jgi:hypothetical protein
LSSHCASWPIGIAGSRAACAIQITGASQAKTLADRASIIRRSRRAPAASRRTMIQVNRPATTPQPTETREKKFAVPANRLINGTSANGSTVTTTASVRTT